MDIIQQLRNSNNKLLEAEARDLQTWKKLNHTKEDLELLLMYNIAQIDFVKADGTSSSIVGTASTPLIKVFSAKTEKDKQKAAHLKTRGMRSNKSSSVEIWDLTENTQKTILLKAWQIVNFITISEENVLLLDTLLHDAMKK